MRLRGFSEGFKKKQGEALKPLAYSSVESQYATKRLLVSWSIARKISYKDNFAHPMDAWPGWHLENWKDKPALQQHACKHTEKELHDSSDHPHCLSLTYGLVLMSITSTFKCETKWFAVCSFGTLFLGHQCPHCCFISWSSLDKFWKVLTMKISSSPQHDLTHVKSP